MIRHRLFLDADVLFSAAYRPEAGIARLWKFSRVELMTSAYAAEEARVNLASEDQRNRLIGLLRKVQVITGISPLPHGVELPPKDLPILQGAIYSQATHLLTGDRHHFGKLFGHRLAGVLILSQAEYFDRYLP
jgi:uncharacterized protein